MVGQCGEVVGRGGVWPQSAPTVGGVYYGAETVGGVYDGAQTVGGVAAPGSETVGLFCILLI
jgi:hypothetical protein